MNANGCRPESASYWLMNIPNKEQIYIQIGGHSLFPGNFGDCSLEGMRLGIPNRQVPSTHQLAIILPILWGGRNHDSQAANKAS